MRAFRFLLAFAVLAGAAWLCMDLWREAYGSGPPFYGRTTNMDKWTDPRPMLVLVGTVAATIAWWVAPRRRRGPAA